MQLNKLITTIIVSLIIILIGLNYSRIKQKAKIKDLIEFMPDFELAKLEGTRNFSPNILPEQSTLLIFFNSKCEYCIHEIETLNKSIERFRDVNIILFTAQEIDSIRTFINQYEFIQRKNVFVGRNDYSSLSGYFGDLIPPTTYVYDTNGKLIRKFTGATKLENIIDAINTGA